MNSAMEIQEKHHHRYILGRRITTVAAGFTLLVAMFMTADHYLLRTTDPLNTPALHRLMEQLDSDPHNEELRQQIRELDFLARKVFFTRQWQIRTGTLLLIGGGLVFILGLQLMVSSHKRVPDPRRCPGLNDLWTEAGRARRVITAGGFLGLIAVVIIAGFQRQRLLVPAPEDLRSQETAATLSRPDPGPVPDVNTDCPCRLEVPAGPAPGRPPDFYQQWPSFRGIDGSGRAHGASPPLDWDGASGRGIVWKSEIPRPGFSSPAVWNDRIFITGADIEKREVYCYSTVTGDRLWTADTTGIPDAPETLPQVIAETGYAAPSVATDGNRVAAIFGTGVIVCLDFDGRRLWGRSLGIPDNHYGHASSLIIYHDTVIVQYDHFGGSRLKALDLETGATRWAQSRPVDISWASPILIETDGRMQLVLKAVPTVDAYDPVTGEHLWSNECMSGEIGVSPAYADGRIFAANQYAQAVAIDAATGTTLWTTGRPDLPDAASPVATGDYLFLPSSFGAFTCVSAKDGSIVWMHDFDNGGYGSPILVDDLIYWTTAEGVTHIFRAAGEFELIAEAALGEPSVCTPALIGERIYIRGSRHLYCIGPE